VPNAPEPMTQPRWISDSLTKVNSDMSGAACDGYIGYTHTHAHQACSLAASMFQPLTHY